MAEADVQYCILTTRWREWIAKRANDASAPCGRLTGAQVRWVPHMHLSVNYLKQRCSSKQHHPPPVCGERLIPALMYKHTTHNTSSARWCHSVIPGLRLTSPPNLIAVIMAWRWNKSFFGGCALTALPLPDIKAHPIKDLFPVHLVTHVWGVDSKDSTERAAFVTKTKVIDVWTVFKYEAWFKWYFSRIFKSNTAYMFEFSDTLHLPVWEKDQDSVLCINSLIFQLIFFILLQTVASFTPKW